MKTTIALLTDFGLNDVYVGVMKGVIAGINPQARLLDITHAIPPQDVRQGALSLLDAYPYFPAGTIFLVVIDPGVGTARQPIAVQAGGYRFVAPDNGVLSYALATFDTLQVAALNNPDYRLPNVSQTFHGRDIFAPAAAHLAAGVPLALMGDALPDITRLPRPQLTVEGGHITGEVVHIDRFGNVITSIQRLTWQGNDRLTLNAHSTSTPHPLRMMPT
ncbi:SAM-dependent chlorinase/fluorinase, partial [bacterium]|nr:SAM-dependent chlorinase/fluorinase [bacterium]